MSRMIEGMLSDVARRALSVIACLLMMTTILVSSMKVAASQATSLDEMQPDVTDKASLQRGAALYTHYCLGCHSLQYQRYSRIGEDLEIPQDLVEDLLIVSPEIKINDTMRTGMSAEHATAWFGTPPPDLSLVSRLRGTDWIYTYLRSFYRDSDRQWGVNNTVYPQVGMPNVLESLQGVQERVCEASDVDVSSATQSASEHQHCNNLKIVESGSMTTQEFDQVIWDLTNFLAYVGEPSRLKAESMAPKVLIFLLIFTLLAYLLKKEYWRDIH